MLRYITEIRIGLRELHASEHRRDLPHVLEMRAEVLPSGFRGYRYSRISHGSARRLQHFQRTLFGIGYARGGGVADCIV